MPKSHRLDESPKRKVTIDDLLALDDIKHLAQQLLDNAPNIEDAFIAYRLKDRASYHFASNGMHLADAIYMLEAIKYTLLLPEE
jgi:hypothetical protein